MQIAQRALGGQVQLQLFPVEMHLLVPLIFVFLRAVVWTQKMLRATVILVISTFNFLMANPFFDLFLSGRAPDVNFFELVLDSSVSFFYGHAYEGADVALAAFFLVYF